MEINVVALRTIRELSGLSQAELSRRSGINQGYISTIEGGKKSPRPGTVRRFAGSPVRRFADALGVPVGALVGSDPAVSPLPSIDPAEPFGFGEVLEQVAAAIDDPAEIERTEPARVILRSIATAIRNATPDIVARTAICRE